MGVRSRPNDGDAVSVADSCARPDSSAAQPPDPTAAQGHAPRGRFSRVLVDLGRHRWAQLLLIPSILLVGVVVIYPVLQGILLSFQDYRLTSGLGRQFHGLTNYRRLFSDPVARIAFTNTFIYVAGGVAIQLLVGLAAAQLLRRSRRGIWSLRLIVMLPWFMPPVVTAHMWSSMLDARVGVINDILVRTPFLARPPAWFSDPDIGLYSVMAIELWRSYPFFTLFILAGLLTIPEEIDEAARLDGAGPWQHFRYVTWPFIRPIIAVACILQAIRLVNVPDLLIVLTGGGPANATQVASLYAFLSAYRRFDFGYAATISVALMVILLGFTIVAFKVSSRE